MHNYHSFYYGLVFLTTYLKVVFELALLHVTSIICQPLYIVTSASILCYHRDLIFSFFYVIINRFLSNICISLLNLVCSVSFWGKGHPQFLPRFYVSCGFVSSWPIRLLVSEHQTTWFIWPLSILLLLLFSFWCPFWLHNCPSPLLSSDPLLMSFIPVLYLISVFLRRCLKEMSILLWQTFSFFICQGPNLAIICKVRQHISIENLPSDVHW